jgi:hypothetical protein
MVRGPSCSVQQQRTATFTAASRRTNGTRSDPVANDPGGDGTANRHTEERAEIARGGQYQEVCCLYTLYSSLVPATVPVMATANRRRAVQAIFETDPEDKKSECPGHRIRKRELWARSTGDALPFLLVQAVIGLSHRPMFTV